MIKIVVYQSEDKQPKEPLTVNIAPAHREGRGNEHQWKREIKNWPKKI